LQFDVITDLSLIVEDLTARLDQMSYQEIAETFLRMGAITRRFLAAVNYRDNPALPLFPRYPCRPPAPPRLVVPSGTVSTPQPFAAARAAKLLKKLSRR
jgi:hypothetical protein